MYIYGIYMHTHVHTYIYIVVKTREFSENKVLRVHLLRHVETLCFIYIDDDDDLQTGIYIYIYDIKLLGVVQLLCCTNNLSCSGTT